MPFFVTIEGVEGAGKSTLRSGLADATRQFGIEVVVTREPGATTLGRALRSLLLSPENSNIDPLAELMLFSADRAQHVNEVIRPALNRGALVICDRFIHSTLAYQGYGRGLDLTALRFLNNLVTGGLTPEMVLYLDLSPEVGLTRAQHRVEKSTAGFNLKSVIESGVVPGQSDRFESQSIEFHRAVRTGFLNLAKEPSERFVTIDASKSSDDVLRTAVAAIAELLVRSKK